MIVAVWNTWARATRSLYNVLLKPFALLYIAIEDKLMLESSTDWVWILPANAMSQSAIFIMGMSFVFAHHGGRKPYHAMLVTPRPYRVCLSE